VIGGLDLLGRWIGVPRRLKNVILIVSTFFFAGICGLSASIVRAAVMHSFYYVADTIGERNDSPTSLFVAIFLIVLVNPASVYDVGMWMSFLATFGILATAPIISDMIGWDLPRMARKVLGFLLSLICMTLSAVFFTLPITWTAFGGVSLLSPLANLIFVPLTQIILYLLIVLTLVGGIPFLANPIGQAAQLLISFMTALAEAFSDWKGIYVSLRYPFVAWVIAALIVGVLAVLFIRRVKLAHIFTVFALCCVIYGAGYFAHAQTYKDSAYVYLQTDGKSDAVGVVSGNETVIIDISTGGYSVLSDAVKHAEDFYACEIDVLVLTHYHSYHANTLHRLTESVKVRRLLLPMPSSEQDHEYYRALCDQLEGIVEIETYQADGTQRLEAGNAEIALPRTEYIKRSAHPIVSFSVSLEDKGLSYLGESATETDVYGIKNAVMIFGSHGPSAKHIFDSSPIADSELVIFADRSYMELTDAEAFENKIVFPEDYGGWIRILFE
jgi:competence protein ComEC